MTRPRIICHMHTLLNGKIDGIANPTPAGMRSQKLYFDLFLGKDRFYSGHRGWLSGTRTSRAIMGGFPQPELPTPASRCPPETTWPIPTLRCTTSRWTARPRWPGTAARSATSTSMPTSSS